MICSILSHTSISINLQCVYWSPEGFWQSQKWKKLALRGKTISWFKSYLLNTKQCEHLSSEQTIKTGVPQGSILGPIIFVNDLYECSFHGPLQLYAKDAFSSSGSIHQRWKLFSNFRMLFNQLALKLLFYIPFCSNYIDLMCFQF